MCDTNMVVQRSDAGVLVCAPRPARPYRRMSRPSGGVFTSMARSGHISWQQ